MQLTLGTQRATLSQATAEKIVEIAPSRSYCFLSGAARLLPFRGRDSFCGVLEVTPGSSGSVTGAVSNTCNPGDGRTQRLFEEVKQGKDLGPNQVQTNKTDLPW